MKIRKDLSKKLVDVDWTLLPVVDRGTEGVDLEMGVVILDEKDPTLGYLITSGTTISEIDGGYSVIDGMHSTLRFMGNNGEQVYASAPEKFSSPIIVSCNDLMEFGYQVTQNHIIKKE